MSDQPQAVLVGLATLDVIQRVGDTIRWGEKTFALSTEMAAGGPAANAAVATALHLGHATLITALGHSPSADIVREDLRGHGVRIIDVAPYGDEPVPVSSCLIDPDGERTVISTGAMATTAEMTQEAHAAIAAADGVLLDGHHPVLAGQALEVANQHLAITVLDAGSVKQHAEQWLPHLDVVAASADYARGLGCTSAEALDHLLARGARAAVITTGAEPIEWRDRDRCGQVAPPTVRAVDTLGAGDAFHGGLLAGLLLHEGDLLAAIDLATLTASTRVAFEGARNWLPHAKELTARGPRGGS